MKETAINSIYVILHCIAEDESELENIILAEKGYVWEAYFRKDTAEKEAEELNYKFNWEYEMNGKIYYHKYVVIERVVI